MTILEVHRGLIALSMFSRSSGISLVGFTDSEVISFRKIYAVIFIYVFIIIRQFLHWI